MNTSPNQETHAPTRRKILPYAVTCLIAAALPGAALAQAHYDITDLGTLPGYSCSYTWNVGLNNKGMVAAYSNNAFNPNAFAGDAAFLWKGPGSTEPLPGLPGSTDTIPSTLNDHGQIAGMSGAAVWSDAHAVLWDHDILYDLGTLPGDASSDAAIINNNGVIVGDSYNADLSVFRAVYWDRRRNIHLLPSLPNGNYTAATAINDHGQIVGISGPDSSQFRGVSWLDGRIIELGSLGGDLTTPSYINNSAQICGYATLASGDSHPFLWQNGRIVDLGTLGTDVFGGALAVNDSGLVVGLSGGSLIDVAASHAVLWAPRKTIDLQTRISPQAGWVLQGATGINNRGQIIGYGWHKGELRAFLMTPKD